MQRKVGRPSSYRPVRNERALVKMVSDHLPEILEYIDFPPLCTVLIDKPLNIGGKKSPGNVSRTRDTGLLARPDFLIFHENDEASLFELKAVGSTNHQFNGISQLLLYQTILYEFYGIKKINKVLVAPKIHELTQIFITRNKLDIVTLESNEDGLIMKWAEAREVASA